MMGVREVQNGVGNQDHLLLMLTQKCSGKRLVPDLDYDSFSDPLPKLSLSGPELLPIAADYQRRALLLLSFRAFLDTHFSPSFSLFIEHTSPLTCFDRCSEGESVTRSTRREASLFEGRLDCQRVRPGLVLNAIESLPKIRDPD